MCPCLAEQQKIEAKSPPEHNQQFSQLDDNDKEIIAGYEGESFFHSDSK